MLFIRKISLLLAAAVFSSALAPVSASAVTEPKISAKSAIVIRAEDGKVLYAKNEHERLPIASTTKIMTALLTLEAAERNDRVVTITPEMVRVEGSSMGLRVGDKLTLSALAEGMLSVSGNDAANSAAIAVGGSLDRFADLMNEKARELNLRDTHYVTPSGLDDQSHYSSAADLATLTAAAMKNSRFSGIVAQKKIHIDVDGSSRIYTNHNRLLSLYDGCVGVKTGFTKKSGRCLVSAAEKNGVKQICVTLSDPDDWKDHKTLLDYGFSRLVTYALNDSGCTGTVPVVGGVQARVSVAGTSGGNVVLEAEEAAGMKRLVELPRFLYAPVTKGQVVGRVIYVCSGMQVAQTDIVAQENVPREARKPGVWENLISWFRNLFRLA